MNQYIIICSSRKYPYRPSPSHWGHFCFRPPHPWNFHDLPAWLGTPKREYFHPQCTSRTLANSKVTVSCSTGQLRDYYLTNLTCSPLKKSSKSHHHPSEIVSFWIPPPPPLLRFKLVLPSDGGRIFSGTTLYSVNLQISFIVGNLLFFQRRWG